MQQQWIRLPMCLLHMDLSRSAVLVASILIDRDTGNHSVSITADELARATALSRRSVCSALNELRTARIILSTCRTGRGSTYNLAELLPPKKRSQKPTESVEKYKAFINQFS